MTRARVTAASDALASDAFAWLSEARQSPRFGRGQAAATPRGAPQKGRVVRPSPYVIPTSGRCDRIGRTPVRSVVNRQAAPVPLLAAQPVFTQYLPRCSRRSRLKFFAELFSKSGEYRRVQHPRQPRCACHGFCWRKALRLNRPLRPAARSLRGLRPGAKGAAPSLAASPKRRAKTFDRRGVNHITYNPPHCSRRSRTKFFAEAFFQKGWI